MTRLKKSLLASDMSVDYGQRIIQGYFSKFTPDPTGDLTRKGTFTKTITERGPRQLANGEVRSRIKMGFNHGDVIGIPIMIQEDDTGAYFEGRVDEHELGDRILTRIKSGSLDSCSFEYSVINSTPTDGDKSVKRILTEVKLYELGPVDYPMHEDANILGSKQAIEEGIGELREQLLELINAKNSVNTELSELKALYLELTEQMNRPAAQAALDPEVKAQPTSIKLLELLRNTNFKIN